MQTIFVRDQAKYGSNTRTDLSKKDVAKAFLSTYFLFNKKFAYPRILIREVYADRIPPIYQLKPQAFGEVLKEVVADKIGGKWKKRSAKGSRNAVKTSKDIPGTLYVGLEIVAMVPNLDQDANLILRRVCGQNLEFVDGVSSESIYQNFLEIHVSKTPDGPLTSAYPWTKVQNTVENGTKIWKLSVFLAGAKIQNFDAKEGEITWNVEVDPNDSYVKIKYSINYAEEENEDTDVNFDNGDFEKWILIPKNVRKKGNNLVTIQDGLAVVKLEFKNNSAKIQMVPVLPM